MNLFRFVADMLHLSAICILLYRIRKSRNCIGKYHYIRFTSAPSKWESMGVKVKRSNG